MWQFHEVHTIAVGAPPATVFDAIRRVRADEILLFRALTWIRRGGRALPENILNAGSDAPLIDIALRGGFLRLADDAPRELVIGTMVGAPSNADHRRPLTPDLFLKPLPPGFALEAARWPRIVGAST